MLKSCASFSHGFTFEDSMKFRGSDCTTTMFVYRDEYLNKKANGTLEKGDCGIAAGTAVDDKAAVMRVKVKMTKQEAARLLAKCKNGGVLEFKDVARGLVEIPASRVSIVQRNLKPIVTRKSAALDSIPE